MTMSGMIPTKERTCLTIAGRRPSRAPIQFAISTTLGTVADTRTNRVSARILVRVKQTSNVLPRLSFNKWTSSIAILSDQVSLALDRKADGYWQFDCGEHVLIIPPYTSQETNCNAEGGVSPISRQRVPLLRLSPSQRCCDEEMNGHTVVILQTS